MLGQQSLRSHPDTPFVPKDGTRAISTRHSPRENYLLAALPAADYARLLPALEPVSLPPGWTIHGAGDREKYLYFIAAGVVSRFYVMENGASAAFALTGSEGVIGVASFMGGESTPSQAEVLSAGRAYRMQTDLLNSEFDRASPLQHMLLRYAQFLITQTAQSAACYRHHTVKQQLCRWILSCVDRLQCDELLMTQELIANMLGVRREGVTEAAGRLQEDGLIHYRRGHIEVTDRAKLEARVCECYSVEQREYDRLLLHKESIDCQLQPFVRDAVRPLWKRSLENVS